MLKSNEEELKTKAEVAAVREQLSSHKHSLIGKTIRVQFFTTKQVMSLLCCVVL